MIARSRRPAEACFLIYRRADGATFVRRLGCVREGYSPRHLKMAGRWRDPERWALLVEDWRAAGRRRV